MPTDEQFCQSCCMPLKSESDLGTNEDGSKNSDYCQYCFEGGNFTSDVTMEEMMDVCCGYMVKDGMDETTAKNIMQQTLPNLKRWKKSCGCC